MIVVNLFGGAGSGKSTGAAYIFSQLKVHGVNAELVTEFAKDMTWEHNNKALTNQVYMLGNQLQRIYRCQDQVDVIITDSPLPLNIIYNESPTLGEAFDQLVMNVFNSYNNMNYFINRVKPYNPIGRNQTEKEASAIACKIKKFLIESGTSFKEVDGDIVKYQQIVQEVLEAING